MDERRVASFGSFSFDVTRGELRLQRKAIALAPKAALLLDLMIRNPNQILLREEILDEVWGPRGRVSADARLNSCVRRLRGALGDDAHSPQYIETVHRRGYRFLPEVRWDEPEVPFEESSTRPGVLSERAMTRPRALLARRSSKALGAALAFGALVVAMWVATDDRGVLPPEWETSYLRGRHLATSGSIQDVYSGREMLLRITDVTPALSGAWSALAVAEARLGAYAKADRFARTALELSPTSAEAHTVLAETAIGLRWDLGEAESHILKAIRLDPRSSHAHSTYAFVLALRGRWDEASTQGRRALALDPLRTLTAGDLAFFSYWARRFDQSIEQARRILAVEPNFRSALAVLRLSLLAQGDLVAAAVPTRSLIQLTNDEALKTAVRGAGPTALQELYLAWKEDVAEKSLVPERWVRIAMIRAELGDLDAAAGAIRSALEEGAPGLPMVLVDPRFDALKEAGELALVAQVVRGVP